VWQSPSRVVDCHKALTSHYLYGAVLVSTGVVRLDKRAVAPNHDKMGNFLNLTDNRTVALAA